MLIILMVCMGEALYGHLAQLPANDEEEPLFAKVG